MLRDQFARWFWRRTSSVFNLSNNTKLCPKTILQQLVAKIQHPVTCHNVPTDLPASAHLTISNNQPIF
jgi:hypothetical protein